VGAKYNFLLLIRSASRVREKKSSARGRYQNIIRGLPAARKPFRILLAPCRSLRRSKVVSYCLASICLMYHARCTSARTCRVTFRCNREKMWHVAGMRLFSFITGVAVRMVLIPLLIRSDRHGKEEVISDRISYIYIYFISLKGESFLKDFFFKG